MTRLRISQTLIRVVISAPRTSTCGEGTGFIGSCGTWKSVSRHAALNQTHTGDGGTTTKQEQILRSECVDRRRMRLFDSDWKRDAIQYCTNTFQPGAERSHESSALGASQKAEVKRVSWRVGQCGGPIGSKAALVQLSAPQNWRMSRR